MSAEIISALISGLAHNMAEVVDYLLHRKRRKKNSHKGNPSNGIAHVTFLDTNHHIDKLLNNVNSLMMYTVNSYELLNQLNLLFERNQQLKINNVTILVRKKPNETPEDLAILNTNISLWKNMVNNNKINNLTIIGYDHDPDHYYTIIGDKLVFCGQVFFDTSKPTGTNVDYSPLVFIDDTPTGQQVIKNYQKHFDNVVKHYKKSLTLYTTDE